MQMSEAYPVESKPLNNNPDTWNFGEGWLYFNPRNSSDPSAAALIATDPHIKKSKITPKSIFIAPNAYIATEQNCPNGYRVDDNGKCIKTVTINQDEILAARISELFGVDGNPNKSSDFDSDYYDFGDESENEKDSGPLQFNLALPFDIEEDVDGKKVEYVIEEKFVVRNLNPKDVTTTTEKLEETTTSTTTTTTTTVAPTTESTESVTTEEAINSSTVTIEEAAMMTTTTESSTTDISTNKDDEVDVTSTMLMPVTEEITEISTTSTEEPSTTTSTTTTTTTTPASTSAKPTTVKIFNVDFLPKSQRKSNRLGVASARLKNSRDRDKIDRPRKQKTTAASLKTNEKTMTKLYKIDRDQIGTPKKNRTRNGSKRPNRKFTTTTEIVTTETAPVTTVVPPTQKPFWWLPKGWTFEETKEKPVLVRFWSKQPLQQDERARSHDSRQRMNSKMPTDNIFREITASELDTVLKK